MNDPDPRSDGSAASQAAPTVRFDTFLLVAAATVLVTRSLLAATGYPQVGGHTDLHVAHVLWGGLLMGTAVVVMTVSLGSAAKFRATVVGGVGFGLFIDEVGKFLTKDVDYFFKPAVAIIYGVLLTAYVIGRTALARMRLTPARARALAAVAVVDQSLGQLTEVRRRAALRTLEQVGTHEDTASLAQLLDAPSATGSRRAAQDAVTRARDRAAAFVMACADRRPVRVAVIVVLAALALTAIGEAAAWVLTDRTTGFGRGVTAAGWLSSSVVGAVLVGAGLVHLRRHWIHGLQLIRAGLLLELLVTDVFKFAVIQFAALASFALHAALLAVVTAAIANGRRPATTADPTAVPAVA